MNEERPTNQLGFNELLLGGVLLIMGFLGVMAVALYVLPTDPLLIPELQPAVQVTREADFPVGASRVITWGERIILVVRSREQGFVALQGTAPNDGCILRWDPDALRIVSPCSHLVYDLFGNVVTGLTTAPLRRYSVFLRGSFVYVADS